MARLKPCPSKAICGTASLTTSELNVGGNELTAAYSGDMNFAASISPIVVAYRSPKPR